MTVDLSHLEGDFAGAQEQKGSNFDSIPDGRYHVVVIDAEVKRSKPRAGLSQGAPMLAWTMKIVEGQHSNRMLWRNNMLETKENLGWLKKDLGICGLRLEHINDLNARCGELIGLHLEVQKKTGEKYSNVYINRLLEEMSLEEPSPSAPAGGGPQDETDSIPF